MPSPNPGLKAQASVLIAENALKDQLLAVLCNKCGDNDKVEISIENLFSLRAAFDANSKLIQKMDKKIDQLNEELFNA